MSCPPLSLGKKHMNVSDEVKLTLGSPVYRSPCEYTFCEIMPDGGLSFRMFNMINQESVQMKIILCGIHHACMLMQFPKYQNWSSRAYSVNSFEVSYAIQIHLYLFFMTGKSCIFKNPVNNTSYINKHYLQIIAVDALNHTSLSGKNKKWVSDFVCAQINTFK